MNNLTNKLFTKVVDFAQTPGVIANAADKLLSHILPKDDVAAYCLTLRCGFCAGGRRPCWTCCAGYGCKTTYRGC
jgi:hypothetical protein